jgi:hypothetical protein
MRQLRNSRYIENVRMLRWQWRVIQRRYRKRRIHSDTPRDRLPVVFGNAITKSGSHLLAQYLQGVSAVTALVFTSEQPVRKIAPEGRERKDMRVSKDLTRLKPGDIAWGYIPSRSPFTEILTGPGWITYFIFRDPRDRIMSHIFYATEIHPGHAMRDFYSTLGSMDEKVEATIRGVPGMLPSIREAYASYRGWLERPEILKVKFEDLIEQRSRTIEQMLQPLDYAGILEHIPDRNHLLHDLEQAMSPTHSSTFRAGRVGTWEEYFSPSNKALFKKISGDLLFELGYETDNDW